MAQVFELKYNSVGNLFHMKNPSLFSSRPNESITVMIITINFGRTMFDCLLGRTFDYERLSRAFSFNQRLDELQVSIGGGEF